ncbi:MAG: diaminopimelate decarboxylase [Sandaracinaceae bacterium]
MTAPIDGDRTMSPDPFGMDDGEARCDRWSLADVAARYGTPTYVYSARAIDEAYDALVRALPRPALIAYAVKANGNLAVLRRLAARGCGADIVSGGELARCLRAGIEPGRIVYSGVGKTPEELAAAAEAGVRAIHVESVPELDVLEGLGRTRGAPIPVTLRINPDVDPETHPYVATGLHGTKFGLEVDVARSLLPRLVASPHLRFEGVACHIGSQLPRVEPMEDAVALLAAFAEECRQAGAELRTLDAGGGWPIAYGNEEQPFPSWAAYGAAIERGLRRGRAEHLDLIVEPGRALVGNAGVLLTRVILVKEQAGKRFVVCDGAMTELIRPSLYRAHHEVRPVRPRPGPVTEADVVGPVCETADFLARDRPLPPVEAGDLLLVHGAGAYGASMGSTYNGRPLAAEVLVTPRGPELARRRQTLDDLTRLELP